MKPIYFDTEFEGLFDDARLVSIGLVDGSGLALGRGLDTFYAEATGSYRPEQCSAFCRSSVLPLLEGGRHAMSLPKLQASLSQWLTERGAHAVLVCDSPRDLSQITALFPQGLPPNCSCRALGPMDKWRRRIVNVGDRLYARHGLRPHHALDDALVNHMIFKS
jgi:hypothetical protein